MESLLTLTVILLALVLWFWAILDINRSRFTLPAARILWFLLVLTFPILGPLAYFQLKDRFTQARAKRRFQPDFGKLDPKF